MHVLYLFQVFVFIVLFVMQQIHLCSLAKTWVKTVLHQRTDLFRLRQLHLHMRKVIFFFCSSTNSISITHTSLLEIFYSTFLYIFIHDVYICVCFLCFDFSLYIHLNIQLWMAYKHLRRTFHRIQQQQHISWQLFYQSAHIQRIWYVQGGSSDMPLLHWFYLIAIVANTIYQRLCESS